MLEGLILTLVIPACIEPESREDQNVWTPDQVRGDKIGLTLITGIYFQSRRDSFKVFQPFKNMFQTFSGTKE